MYTGTKIARLITDSGFCVERMEGITRGENAQEQRRVMEILAGMNLPDIPSYFYYQYLVRAVLGD